MKGLFYKDFVSIWASYRKNALLVLVVYTFMCVTMDLPFLMYAMVFLLGLYTLTSLTFDEQSHWDTYCRTLPVSAGQVVGVKYLMGLLFMGFGTLLCMALLCAIALYRGALAALLLEYLCGSLTALAVVLLYYAISFPLSYQFGAAKARSAVMLAMSGIGAVFFFIGVYLPGGREMVRQLDTLGIAQFGVLVAVFTAVGFLAYLLSWALSTAIYKRKEY